MNNRFVLKNDRAVFSYMFDVKRLVNPTGLYIYHSGITEPSPAYYVERPVPSGLGQGGMFLLEYVESGKGYIECGGKTHVVTGGTMYLLNRMTTHRYYSDKDDPMRKRWIAFTGPLAHGMVDGTSLLDDVYTLEMNASSHFVHINNLLGNMTDANYIAVHQEIAGIILRLFLAIASSAVKMAPATTAERVKAFIDSSESPVLYLDEIAERFGISKAHLIGIFNRAYGITPHKYITDRKIDAAKQMFEHTDSSIADVSDLLGFSSTQYFSRVFKERCGLTPGEYLRTYRRL